LNHDASYQIQQQSRSKQLLITKYLFVLVSQYHFV
jgi:hypothetical protein